MDKLENSIRPGWPVCVYEQEESESERDPNRWGSELLVDNLTGLGGDRTQFDPSCSSINPSCTHTHTHTAA